MNNKINTKTISKSNSRTNNSKPNLTNNSQIQQQQQKEVLMQEINTLKKTLKNEVREVKGQSYTDTFLKIIEKQYKNIIEELINKRQSINFQKNSELFKKVLDKNKKKVYPRNSQKSELKSFNNKSSSSIKISDTSRTFFTNNSFVKKNKTQKMNSCTNSTYWEDYNFLKVYKNNQDKNKTTREKSPKEISDKKSADNEMSERSTSKIKNNFNNDKIDNYYLLLIQKRKKDKDISKDDDEKRRERENSEKVRKYMRQIFNEDENLKKNLEDENLSNFCKRCIVQEERKKDKLFDKIFSYNYYESQSLKGPKICNCSRFICKNNINYEPIYKRIDKVLVTKRIKLDKIKSDIEKSNELSLSSKMKNV